MDKVSIQLSTFAKVINVHSYASAINKKHALFDSELEALKPIDEINLAHLAWSSFSNWSPSEFEHCCRKAMSQSGINAARQAVYEAMDSFTSDVEAIFIHFKDPNIRPMADVRKKIDDALQEWRVPKTYLDAAPSFQPAVMQMEDGTTSIVGEADITDVENLSVASGTWSVVQPKRKITNPAAKGKYVATDFEIQLPRIEAHADIDTSEPHPIVDDSGSVNVDAGVFPPSAVRMLSFVYEPGFNAPFVKGQRILLKDIGNFAMNQITWEPVKKPVFYRTSQINVYAVKAIFDRGLISPSMYLLAVSKASDEFSDLIGLTEEECLESGATKGQLRSAILEYQKAQCIRLLKDAKLDNKVSFVDTWFDRLKDIVDDIDSSHCGHMFKASLKRAVKMSSPGKEVNRAFYSFKLGQLAVWKKGRTRVEVIQDSTPAVTYFWGAEADKYIDLWKASPLAQYNMRSAYGRLSTDARRIYQESKLKAKATINAAHQLSKESLQLASNVIAEENQVFEALAEGLTFTERAKLRFSRAWNASKKIPGIIKQFKPETDSRFSKVKTGFSHSLGKVKGFFTRLWLSEVVVATTISENDDGTSIIIERKGSVPTTLNFIVGYIPRRLGQGLAFTLGWIGGIFNKDVIQAVNDTVE